MVASLPRWTRSSAVAAPAEIAADPPGGAGDRTSARPSRAAHRGKAAALPEAAQRLHGPGPRHRPQARGLTGSAPAAREASADYLDAAPRRSPKRNRHERGDRERFATNASAGATTAGRSESPKRRSDVERNRSREKRQRAASGRHACNGTGAEARRTPGSRGPLTAGIVPERQRDAPRSRWLALPLRRRAVVTGRPRATRFTSEARAQSSTVGVIASSGLLAGRLQAGCQQDSRCLVADGPLATTECGRCRDLSVRGCRSTDRPGVSRPCSRYLPGRRSSLALGRAARLVVARTPSRRQASVHSPALPGLPDRRCAGVGRVPRQLSGCPSAEAATA